MRAWIVISVLALTACAPANVNDAEYWTPSSANIVDGDETGTADVAGTTPADDAGTTSPPRNCLHVEFTTVSVNGRYAPNHVAAVWITDSSNKFVKTLREWGVRRSGYLSSWRASSSANTVDAVTGATLRLHGPLAMDWNCTDTSENRVADGQYTVHAEFTETNGSGPSFTANFVVGSAPSSDTPDESKGFTTKLIQFTP